MKRLGYIQGTRIRGPVNLGPLGTIDVAGASNLRGLVIMFAGLITAGVSTFGGMLIASAGMSVAGLATFGGLLNANAGFSAAGAITLGGPVICSSSLQIAVGGLLTIPQRTVATDLPAADPGVPGELWCDTNVVTRSA